MNNISSIENLINELPEGYSNYLKICLDPYHDKSIRFEGAPSSRSATSVTLCINQELSLGADDFGINATTNPTWDAHIVMYPFLASHNMLSGYWDLSQQYTNELVLNPTAAFTLYPLSVHGVPSGTPTYSMEDAGVGHLTVKGLHNGSLTTFSGSGLTYQSTARRCLRIVGESFEVIDESPEMYQQGTCTVYRYPLDTSLNRALVVGQHGLQWPTPSAAQAFVKQPHEIYSLKAPPSNPASAVLVSGSETWKSQEGAYVVGTQYETEIPFKTCDTHRILCDGVYPPTEPRWADASTAAYLFGDQSLILTDYAASGPLPVTTTTYSKVDACFPFNMSGAYFTNLSSTYGALRIRYRVYVEILTDPTDLTLVPLASPTLPYKQSLMETIMEIISHQPSGVPQSWNPEGKAWRKILGTIGSVIKRGAPLGAVFAPEAGIVMNALGDLAVRTSKSGKKPKKPGTEGRPKAAPKPAGKT